MIKAVIVDDEAPARRELRRLLDVHNAIHVVGEAADLAGARSLLLRVRPDVIFLDIRLGRQSGFDLLSDVDAETAVVFVTAFDTYAVQGFEASAIDFLLKPVEPARLARSIERLCRLFERSGTAGAATSSPQSFVTSRWIFVDTGQQPEFIEVDAITHLVAEVGATRIHTADGTSRLTSKPLIEWERRLAAGDFKRVHRAAIVNIRHVQRVEPWSNYSYRLHIVGAAEPVTMSRRHALSLRDDLG